MFDEKIYAISDLHVDQEENMKWVEKLSDWKYLNDTIIIPGDVTHSLSKLVQTLKIFKSKFNEVYFCPGNHELWTQSEKEDEQLHINNSIEKFHYIIKVCNEIGVHTKPGVTDQGVIIIPLNGWYDGSLHRSFANHESDLRLWSDHYRCKWTDEVPQSEAAKYFVQWNEQFLSNLNKTMVTQKLSHFHTFLTSRKLMDAYYDEMISRRQKLLQQKSSEELKQEASNEIIKPNFSLVAGTELLNEQLKLIKPQVHIFGHSHRKMVLDIGDGIRYINNPLGYIRERAAGVIQPPYELYEIVLK